MSRPQVVFLLTGLTAGILMVVIGHQWSSFLVFGVGFFLFVAVLAAIALTGLWTRLDRGLWRILVGFCICTGAYLLAFLTVVAVGGYWADWLRIQLSTDIRFGADLWVGLLAASLVAAAGVELLVYVLIGKWSNFFFLCLSGAGFIAVLGTFLGSLITHRYWSFMGLLLPVGNALFCWLIGAQIGRNSQRNVRA